MTAQELHIDFDINLQEINSNSTRNIESEEKDWILNKEVIKFLNRRTGAEFEDDTKRLKDVAPLIKTKILDVVQINDKKGKVILPPFIYKPIKSTAIYYKDCVESIPFPRTITNKVFKFKLPAKGDLKVNIILAGKQLTLYNSNDFPYSYIGNDKVAFFKSFIIEIRRKLLTDNFKDIEVYYEWFGDKYEQDTFFIVGNTKLVLVEVKPTSADSVPYPITSFLYTYIQNSSNKQIEKPCRTINTENIDWKVDSYLSGSLQESPLIELQKGEGFVYFPKNTIVKRLIFTYICRPNLIDIHLSTSLNLDTDVCAEIVMEATRFTKALIDSGNYEKYFNETNLIE